MTDITNSKQNIQDAVTVYTAIRQASLEDGWELFVQVIKSATDQAFATGQGMVINYLESEDFHISSKDYDAMKALKPE